MVVEMAEIAEISEIAEMPMVAWAHGPKILRVALVAYWDIGMGVGWGGPARGQAQNTGLWLSHKNSRILPALLCKPEVGSGQI
jgi:hypothetical protein